MNNIPSISEARDILDRFCASHFNRTDREHARASIPADPKRDDDIRMAAFIDGAENLGKVAHELAKALEEAKQLVEMCVSGGLLFHRQATPEEGSPAAKIEKALEAYRAVNL